MNNQPFSQIWPNDWAVFWVLICTVHLTVCFYHVTYAFYSESTLYSCLNVKETLARSRREIWSLSDWNWNRTDNSLVHKQTFNHLAKLAKLLWVLICTVHLTVRSYHVTNAFKGEATLYSVLWVRVQLRSLKLPISGLLRARSSLTFRQL